MADWSQSGAWYVLLGEDDEKIGACCLTLSVEHARREVQTVHPAGWASCW